MGITRDTVIRLAEDIGLTVAQRRLTETIFILLTRHFYRNSRRNTPIRELDGRTVGNAQRSNY